MWRLPRRGEDSGISLVEVLVAVVLMAVVSTFVAESALVEHKALRVQDDQSQGLADVRVAVERLSQDIRDARSVLCNPSGTDAALAAADPTCVYHLQLWIDSDSDYLQQSSETVTWQLVPDTDGIHYDMVRTVGSGASQIEARTVVHQVAFTYAPVQPAATEPAATAAHTTEVQVAMTYRATAYHGVVDRTVSVTDRLRNVA